MKVVGRDFKKLLACSALALPFQFGAVAAGSLPEGWPFRSDFPRGCLCDSDGEPS